MNSTSINNNKMVYTSPATQITNHKFFTYLTSLEAYKTKYKERFIHFYNYIMPDMLEFVDEYSDLVETSSELDGKRWDKVYNFGWSAHIPTVSHSGNIKELKTWLQQRVDFLKKQLEM